MSKHHADVSKAGTLHSGANVARCAAMGVTTNRARVDLTSAYCCTRRAVIRELGYILTPRGRASGVARVATILSCSRRHVVEDTSELRVLLAGMKVVICSTEREVARPIVVVAEATRSWRNAVVRPTFLSLLPIACIFELGSARD